MHAGTIALLTEDLADEPIESEDHGWRTVAINDEITYLDGATVQTGRVVDQVETQDEHVWVERGDGEDDIAIEVEREKAEEKVWTDFIADVTDTGFVVAERTEGEDDKFPFELLRAAIGEPLALANVNVPAFAAAQDDMDVWLVGRKDLDEVVEPVAMDYNDRDSAEAATEANVGLGFRTAWNGTMVKGVLYASGYIAIYEKSFAETQFARFLRDQVLPHAYIPEGDTDPEQATLDNAGEESPYTTAFDSVEAGSTPEGGDSFTEEVADHLKPEGADIEDAGNDEATECADCGNEPTKSELIPDEGDMVCIVCKDKRDEEREEKLAESKARADGGEADE